MSQETQPIHTSILKKIVSNSHLIGLFTAIALVLLTRLYRAQHYITDDNIQFDSPVASAHYLYTHYLANSWPTTAPNVPYLVEETTSPETYGTLYEQFLAGIAVILGGGTPSNTLVLALLAITPVLSMVVIVIGTYALAYRIADRVTATLAALILALFPGVVYQIGVFANPSAAGFRAMMFILSIVFIMKTFEKPINYNTILSKPKQELRSIVFAVAAGTALSAYIFLGATELMWPTILVVTFLLYARTISHNNEFHASFTGVISIAAVVTILLQQFHAGVYLASLAGIYYILSAHAFSRNLLTFDPLEQIPDNPIKTTVLVTALLGWAATTYTTLIPTIHTQFTNQQSSILSASNPLTGIYTEFGLVFFAALGGFALIFKNVLQTDPWTNIPAPHTLFTSMTIFAFPAAVASTDFVTLAAIPCAIAGSILFVQMLREVADEDSDDDLTVKQVGVALFIVVCLVPALLFPPAGTVVGQMDMEPNSEHDHWDEPLDWTTNAVETTDSMNVMTHTEYGYWVAEATHGNVYSSSTHASSAPSEFFLAQSEAEAESTVTSQPEFIFIDWKMITPGYELNSLSSNHPDYASDSLYDPVYEQGESEDVLNPTFVTHPTEYHQSMLVRLYHYHGSMQETQPIITQTNTRETSEGVVQMYPQNRAPVTTFTENHQAKDFAEENEDATHGGIGVFPQEDVSALENYRLVTVSSTQATENEQYKEQLLEDSEKSGLPPEALVGAPQWVKGFQRVPGATITGSAPANSTVTVETTLEMPTGTEFRYAQETNVDSAGDFTMVVPYSTTGYDNESLQYVPEVQGEDPYTITSDASDERLSVHVSEKSIQSDDADGYSVSF